MASKRQLETHFRNPRDALASDESNRPTEVEGSVEVGLFEVDYVPGMAVVFW